MLEAALTVAVLLLASPETALAADTPSPVEVKVTQSHLVPACLDGAPTRAGDRSWRLLPGPHSLAFTMKNEPRHGSFTPQREPGFAAISFTLEAGHKYEVEIRAPSTSYSSRVFERGEWKPAVRDRTLDRVVSGEPQWSDAASCGGGS